MMRQQDLELKVAAAERRRDVRIIVNIAGRFCLSSRWNVRRVFACRAVNLSPRAVALATVIIGEPGARYIRFRRGGFSQHRAEHRHLAGDRNGDWPRGAALRGRFRGPIQPKSDVSDFGRFEFAELGKTRVRWEGEVISLRLKW
jgi:hypothetical protein